MLSHMDPEQIQDDQEAKEETAALQEAKGGEEKGVQEGRVLRGRTIRRPVQNMDLSLKILFTTTPSAPPGYSSRVNRYSYLQL